MTLRVGAALESGVQCGEGARRSEIGMEAGGRSRERGNGAANSNAGKRIDYVTQREVKVEVENVGVLNDVFGYGLFFSTALRYHLCWRYPVVVRSPHTGSLYERSMTCSP
ncbi:hypothetical protein BT69DRAFT_148636 [Atractiella rhizophila]|nr:hypothetical protein BT69DRAFT_148636 [Atractiella rhizophila]